MSQTRQAILPVGDFNNRTLSVYALLRLVTATTISLMWLGQFWFPEQLELQYRWIVGTVSGSYLIYSVVALNPRIKPIRAIPVQITTDNICLLLLSAALEIRTGIPFLLVLPAGMGGLLLGGRAALFSASASSLALLGIALLWAEKAPDLPAYGVIGIILLLVALVANVAAQRTRESETRAKAVAIDLNNLTALNEHIVRSMDTGIVVLDNNENIVVSNEAAQRLLALPKNWQHQAIRNISPDLAERLSVWKMFPNEPAAMLRRGAHLLAPTISRLGDDDTSIVLITLQDAEYQHVKSQREKLAALGGLTAGIAHEIRNPLAAISHAGELLAESPELDDADQRLTRIIATQVKRVDAIIENVLQLSRRDQAVSSQLELNTWAKEFVAGYAQRNNLDLKLLQSDRATTASANPSQLEQIVTTLCDNAIRHIENCTRIQLEIVDSDPPRLEVSDNGPGIDPETAERIFEPFFSRADKKKGAGTGLGLYIANELCTAFGAQLKYRPGRDGGSVFSIRFAA